MNVFKCGFYIIGSEKNMIFIAKNEKGIPTWKLARDGKKTVTRRIKALPVGKEFAIQPSRGKCAVCRARVITLCNSLDHFKKFGYDTDYHESVIAYKEKEAKLEGFNSWDGLMSFFQEKNIQFADTFRIEYKLVN